MISAAATGRPIAMHLAMGACMPVHDAMMPGPGRGAIESDDGVHRPTIQTYTIPLSASTTSPDIHHTTICAYDLDPRSMAPAPRRWRLLLLAAGACAQLCVAAQFVSIRIGETCGWLPHWPNWDLSPALVTEACLALGGRAGVSNASAAPSSWLATMSPDSSLTLSKWDASASCNGTPSSVSVWRVSTCYPGEGDELATMVTLERTWENHCVDGCVLCASGRRCITCADGREWIGWNGGACARNGTYDCGYGRFFDGATCAACPPGCILCNSTAACTTCRSHNELWIDGKCVNPCGNGCSRCSGGANSYCIECEYPYYTSVLGMCASRVYSGGWNNVSSYFASPIILVIIALTHKVLFALTGFTGALLSGCSSQPEPSGEVSDSADNQATGNVGAAATQSRIMSSLRTFALFLAIFLAGPLFVQQRLAFFSGAMFLQAFFISVVLCMANLLTLNPDSSNGGLSLSDISELLSTAASSGSSGAGTLSAGVRDALGTLPVARNIALACAVLSALGRVVFIRIMFLEFDARRCVTMAQRAPATAVAEAAPPAQTPHADAQPPPADVTGLQSRLAAFAVAMKRTYAAIAALALSGALCGFVSSLLCFTASRKIIAETSPTLAAPSEFAPVMAVVSTLLALAAASSWHLFRTCTPAAVGATAASPTMWWDAPPPSAAAAATGGVDIGTIAASAGGAAALATPSTPQAAPPPRAAAREAATGEVDVGTIVT